MYTDDVYYKAPEVLLYQKYLKKSDIWSLGCCIIHMITGKRPWYNVVDNIEDLMKSYEQDSNNPSFSSYNFRNSTNTKKC